MIMKEAPLQRMCQCECNRVSEIYAVCLTQTIEQALCDSRYTRVSKEVTVTLEQLWNTPFRIRLVHSSSDDRG